MVFLLVFGGLFEGLFGFIVRFGVGIVEFMLMWRLGEVGVVDEGV